MSSPYNDLYHCKGHTYGTWLPGDPRGFRTRDHRDHVDGDYKNPPPRGTYDDLHKRSKDLMKRDAVFLNEFQQRIVVDLFVNSLTKRRIKVIIGAIDAVHFHVLAPFADHNPRHWVGIAKKESSHYLKVQGHGVEGGIWAVRCQCIPVEDARHAQNSEKYIADHALRGAAILRPTHP